MEFPGGSITNVRVIDGFSNIYWRIYTEEPGAAIPPGDAPNNGHTVLKHISRLKELELRLRSLGCLVLSYPRRLGLLIFSATADFEHLLPLVPKEGRDEANRLLVGSVVLKVWTSGSVSSADLVNSLCSEPQSASANSSGGSQRLQGSSVPPRRVDNSGGSAAIYASFISAVTAAFSLLIVRQNNAIPLGPRTLFGTVERGLDEALNIFYNGSTSVSVLTSLQAQLTCLGKLTVTLQSTAQIGLCRLSQPGGDASEFRDAPPGTDLWLSPNGSIARLVTPIPGHGSSLNSLSASGDTPHGRASVKRWKSNVLEWLTYFGLPVDLVNEESWVEVEVWEPFYAKLSGETARSKEETSSIPLKRILWPAIYCFRRTRSSLPELSDKMEGLSPFRCDPLEFAESWCSREIPQAVETGVKPSFDQQERHTNGHGTSSSPGISSFPEGIESLSRASLYPELQTASLVYPTPPDGAAGIGLNPAVASDMFTEESDHRSSHIQSQARQAHDGQSSSKGRPDADVTIDFGPSAGLVVGSGLYDTNDDDDLFEEINDRDFGSKGITDADFSFFDDPGFDHMENDTHIHDYQEAPDPAGLSKPGVAEQPELGGPSSYKTPTEQRYAPQSSPEQVANHQRDQPNLDNSAVVSSPPRDKVQTISPPLSPVEVKKILFPEPSSNNQSLVKQDQAVSHYSPVTFRHNISSWDQKYGAAGKFWFTYAGTTSAKDPLRSSGDIPTIGLPRQRGSSKAHGTHSNALSGYGSPSNDIVQGSLSSPDSSSETDEDSDDTGVEDNMPPAGLATRKRKRTRSNSNSSIGPASEKASVGSDQEMATLRQEDSIFLGNFLSTFSDWSMAGLFSLCENQAFPALTPREIQVQIAQLLVDQVTQSSLDHKLDGDFAVSCLDIQPCRLQELLEGTEFLGGMERLDLNSLVSLQEGNNLLPAASSGSSTRQTPQRKASGKGSITKLPPPHLRVRRGKDFLETLPLAISFWETFGLEPAHGPKDITAYCIHPHVAAKTADTFLERLGLLYSSCNLGSHTRGDSSDAFDKGLGGWDVTSSKQSNYQVALQQLKVICEELGIALLNSPSNKDSIVVYIINPFSHAASLVDICTAFWCLFQKYTTDVGKQQSKQLAEVVLQIIPIDFVTSAESLVVPSQMEYLNLALEVYSRCAPSQSQASLVNCAPPVVLADPLPTSIGFKLASERFSPLQEGRCLHVACSRSQDQRWVSVAWSDSTGTLQRTMSYCLRFRNSTTSRNIVAVRNEIWAATKDIMDRNQGRWRIILVSTENVDYDEHDTWLKFAEQYNKSKPVPLELTILNVSTNPDLFLSSPLSPLPMSVLNPQASSTPVATPNPSGAILSPDQLANAPTPPGGGNLAANVSTPTDPAFESESDSLLTDICDESWGVVLSHRLNSPLHLTEYRSALASGYLLRRKGPADADGVFTMNVNLLYTARASYSYETVLREIIAMYRDLATLARVRGTRIVQSGTLPWHIATAVRAQEILSYVL